MRAFGFVCNCFFGFLLSHGFKHKSEDTSSVIAMDSKLEIKDTKYSISKLLNVMAYSASLCFPVTVVGLEGYSYFLNSVKVFTKHSD